MLKTPSKFPSVKAELIRYFLNAIHAAPWAIVSAGLERRYRADKMNDLLAWVSAQQIQQQAVGIYLDPARHLIVSADAEARPAEMSMQPTHVISAGRLYLVWRLVEAVGTGDAKRIAAELAKQVRGGVVVQNGVVPLPGTVSLVRRGMSLTGKYPVQMLPPLSFSYRVVSGRLERLERAKQDVEAENRIAVLASSLKAESIKWLWPGVIPLGALTLIAGAAGMGKSQIAIAIAARVTREGGRALIMEAEDDAPSVVLPRLKAAGADVKRCAVGTLTDLSNSIHALTITAKRLGGVRLVVLSPIRAFFKTAEDGGNVGVRKALAPLLEWANANGVAVIGIGHPPKTGRDPFAGSAAYVEVARAAWSVGALKSKNPLLKSKGRIMTPAKCNLAPDQEALGFHIEGVNVDGIETSRVVWAS